MLLRFEIFLIILLIFLFALPEVLELFSKDKNKFDK